MNKKDIGNILMMLLIVVGFVLIIVIVNSVPPRKIPNSWTEIDPPHPGLQCWVLDMVNEEGVWCEPINKKGEGQ